MFQNKTVMVSFTAALLSLGLAGLAFAGPPERDADAVQKLLSAYLAAVEFPEPAALDPEIFAEDIVALWSDGRAYRGRAAMVKAIRDWNKEARPDFTAFKGRPERVELHGEGDLIWLTCELKMTGKLTHDRGDFQSTVRSTFVFAKHGDRWQMVHEHSSRPPDSTGS